MCNSYQVCVLKTASFPFDLSNNRVHLGPKSCVRKSSGNKEGLKAIFSLVLHTGLVLEKTKITELGQNWRKCSSKITDQCYDFGFGRFNGK